MVHLTLPLMYYNFDFNNKIFQISKKTIQPIDLFKIKNINIDSLYGNFPFCIWNGGVNLNARNSQFLIYNDIYQFFNQDVHPSFRLDCSNIYISENDMFNAYQNLILSHGNTGGNFIEISDLGLMDYILSKYPNYDFIFSNNAHLRHNFTIEIINTLLEENTFYLIELPVEFNNNIDFLKQIINKQKVEITISNRCKNTCPNISTCKLQEQDFINNYSENTIFYDCKEFNLYTKNNQLKNEIEFYQKLGFSHFKIDTPPLKDLHQFNQYLIFNLFSEQYQLSIIKDFFDGEI